VILQYFVNNVLHNKYGAGREGGGQRISNAC
jgi:hypothetical protein